MFGTFWDGCHNYNKYNSSEIIRKLGDETNEISTVRGTGSEVFSTQISSGTSGVGSVAARLDAYREYDTKRTQLTLDHLKQRLIKVHADK